MAAETRIETTDPGTNAMDYAEHERTYALFLWLAKWLVITCVVILFAMALFLVGPSRNPAPPSSTAAPSGQAAH